MQIVIDIDENIYKSVKNKAYIYEEEEEDVALSIIGGIPLPKGHGRIIDESQVTGTFIWDNGYTECYAPTIIPADEEKEE